MCWQVMKHNRLVILHVVLSWCGLHIEPAVKFPVIMLA